MNPGIVYYRPEGEPASGTVTFAAIPTAGDSVTVNGTAYVFGTDFFNQGNSVNAVAEGLAAAINADRHRNHLHVNTSLIRPYYAVYYGNKVVIVAVAPGSAGNAITLAKSGANISVSGSTLSGGGFVSAGETWVELTVTTHATVPGTAGRFNATDLFVSRALMYAPTTNTVAVTFGPNSNASARSLPVGTEYEIPPTVGRRFNLKDWYAKAAANSQTISILYIA
jgi:hypothetical protein